MYTWSSYTLLSSRNTTLSSNYIPIIKFINYKIKEKAKN